MVFWVVFFVIIAKYFLDVVAYPWTNKWVVEIYESATQGLISEKIWWIIMIYAGLFVVGSIGQYLTQYYRPLITRYTEFLFFKRVYKNDVDFFISRPAGQITKQLSTMSGNLEYLTLDFWTRQLLPWIPRTRYKFNRRWKM